MNSLSSKTINYPRDSSLWLNLFDQEFGTTSTAESTEKSSLIVDEDHLIKKGRDPHTLSSDELSAIYQYDFHNPKVGVNLQEFFQVKELVLAIETHMKKEEIQDVERIRQKVAKYLKFFSHETRMAELGLILFYLDQNKKMPDENYLLSYRAIQLQTEVEGCLESHAAVTDNPLIPSGKNHCLMRAFAHMVMTKTQIFNRGGVYAIKLLLESSDFLIPVYLQPEHRNHILVIIKQILGKSQFVALFQKKARIHSSLEDIIRLDLKLPPETPIHSVHIFWDLMMMFFSDIRQLNAPNCYAVSALIYGMENHLHKIAKRTLECLNHGYLEIGTGNTIPIAPFIENRQVYYQDLDLVPERGEAITLSPLSHIFSILNIEPEKVVEKMGPVKLKETLSSSLQTARKADHLPFAKKMYYAYKYNTLVHMMILVSEMTYMNQEAAPSDVLQPHSLYKIELIEKCLTSLEVDQKGNQEAIPSLFKAHLRRKLGQRLWFENCSEQKVNVDNQILKVGDRSIIGFKGNLYKLSEVFGRSLRIFSLKGETHEILHSITDLQELIAELIESSANELIIADQSVGALKRRLDLAARSKSFRIAISNYCSKKIDCKGIMGKHLNWSDLFLLDQTGGCEDDVLKLVFNIQVSSEQISQCHTPYQFLERLLEKLNTLDQDSFKSSPTMLITNVGHAWTLATECWDILLQNTDRFYNFIQVEVFNPAKKRMSTWIPKSTIDRVIERYAEEEKLKSEIKNYFENALPLSYSKFRIDFCDRVQKPKDMERIEKIMEEEFAKVTLTRGQFNEILYMLNLKVSDVVFHRIYDLFPEDPLYPFQLANLIREQLIREKIEILEPHEIERELCRVLNLPIAIKLGDTNWVDIYREDPYHLGMEIGFSYIKNTLHYRKRTVDGFEQLENADFKTFTLHHQNLAAQNQPRW